MKSFKEAGLPQPLFHRLEQMGYQTPTPIQAAAIPPAMEGKDILGSAQTGTGKTAAFGIPLVTQLMGTTRGTALVLCPTRELAQQVMVELEKFIGNSNIKTALLIGGEQMPKQVQQIRMRPRLIVGTPGRINDHLTRGSLMLHDVNFFVLDEVDRMLDMGFGIQLDAMDRFLTGKRQTLMFSATLPDNIKKLSAKYLKDPVRVSVGATHKPAANVSQEHVNLSDGEKYPRLIKELKRREGTIIVFVRTKSGADRMATKLQRQGFKADAIHGDLRQSQRNKVISEFRDKEYRILIATDVAARGLDISHIEHVINYDMPMNPEDYIHRIGRTARAGADGEAINFVSPKDAPKWKAIAKLLNPNGDAEEPSDDHGKPGKADKPHGKKPRRNRGGRNRNRNRNRNRTSGENASG